jgi:hypothetical protein
MSWEPWLRAVEPEPSAYDPNDPTLLLNILKTQPESSSLRPWILDHLLDPITPTPAPGRTTS